ncbi:MAG: hypothetical protein V4568_00890 [Pseudomonadota bacterium]
MDDLYMRIRLLIVGPSAMQSIIYALTARIKGFWQCIDDRGTPAKIAPLLIVNSQKGEASRQCEIFNGSGKFSDFPLPLLNINLPFNLVKLAA